MSCGSRVQANSHHRIKCGAQNGFAGNPVSCCDAKSNWMEFPFEFSTTDGDTPPTIPTNSSARARYYINGKKMTVMYFLQNSSSPFGGSDGSTNALYYIYLPNGFNYANNINFQVGSITFRSPPGPVAAYGSMDIAKDEIDPKRTVLRPFALNTAITAFTFGEGTLPLTAPNNLVTIKAEVELY